jgi:hypothetical protein
VTGVSVCIPTYNYGRYVGRAVESVLAQGMGDFELIVVDNASIDETPDVLARFRDPRLRVHRNDSNLGLFGNFRRCLELTSGELVKFLAADDWLLPGYLSAAVALLRRHPTAAIASGPGLYVDDQGAVFGVGVTGVFRPGLVPGADALRAQARFLNVVGMPSNTLLRRDALEAAGGFDERFAPAADVHLWGKLLATHDLAWMDRPGCCLRFHRTKAHDYGVDPTESTFRAWEDLARAGLPRVTSSLVRDALDAEAERSLVHAAAHLGRGQVAAAHTIISFTARHVHWKRALGRFALRLPVLARAQLARALALRAGRLVVYEPAPRIGPSLSRTEPT